MPEIKLQQVIDLTCLIRNDRTKIQAALCDKELANPFLFCLACDLEPDKNINWQIRQMQRKSAKASVEDLRLVEKALRKKQIPYETTLRNTTFPKASYVRSNEHFRNVLARVGFGYSRV